MTTGNLTIEHCEEVLTQSLLMGSSVSRSGKTKKLTFNPWDSLFELWHGESLHRARPAWLCSIILKEYNDL
jgi:hypothetical protein